MTVADLPTYSPQSRIKAVMLNYKRLRNKAGASKPSAQVLAKKALKSTLKQGKRGKSG